MVEKQIYITRPEGEDLYTELQRQTLAELQRLSGKIWTDYNPSDPGVTIADAANYALTETDYKLGFALEDYLADEEGTWAEEAHGLFPPHKAYPSAPVTTEDYRRAILTRFPMVEDVKVGTDKEHGRYDFILRLSPFSQNDRMIEDKVRAFLNRHRNLCEQLGGIVKEEPEELFFHADLEIETGRDTTDILVRIYRTVMQYLSGSVEIMSPAPDSKLPMRVDEWYEGPVRDVRAEIPGQRNTENELYWKLKGIPGIVSFKTCYFMDRKETPVTDFRKGYSIHIPEDFRYVTVRVGREKVNTDMKDFMERLRAGYFMQSTFRTRHFLQEQEEREAENGGRKKRQDTAKSKDTLYRSVFRDVYSHSPIAADLPVCYRISKGDFLRATPAGERAEIRNFGSYMRLFDLLLQRGMNELDGVERLLSIDDTDKSPARMETLPEDILHIRKENDRFRKTDGLRHLYMDFLDRLYGVDSNPAWLREFEYYGLTEDDRLRRRMRFLKALPELLRDRPRSFDLTGAYGGENVPAVKKYLSLLLDFDLDEETTVGNILPGHNLILMGDGEKGGHLHGLMSSQMIDDDVFVTDAVETVEEDGPPETKEEKLKRDEDLRRNLPIFNSNWINGSLFREGISLNNYNLVELGNREWLLVFRGREEEKRMNLGRSDSRKTLNGWANTLCRYLRELNRQCEAVYVVEKGLFDEKEPFTVMLVFTGWTARTYSPRFREACTQLARSVIPAHLKMETYWLGALQMQYFEDGYKKWREALRNNAPEDIRATLVKKISDILSPDFMSRRRKRKDNGENGVEKEERNKEEDA